MTISHIIAFALYLDMENEYMEPEENQNEQAEEHVEIYSKMAIRGFSVFFSPLFGGVLLYYNLKVAGYKLAAVGVLAFSIAYTFVAMMIGVSINSNGILLGLYVAGAFLLSDYFFPKYFPDDDYYPKPIWGALGISILIVVALVTMLYYSGNMPQLPVSGKI